MSQERVDTHSALRCELQATDVLLSWGSSVLRDLALLKGKGVCQEGSPSCLLQLITQLCACLTFGWTCTWGFWARNPASSSLTWSGAHFVSLYCMCVCI